MSVGTNRKQSNSDTFWRGPTTLPDEITMVTETAEAYPNPKQLVDYRSEREACLVPHKYRAVALPGPRAIRWPISTTALGLKL